MKKLSSKLLALALVLMLMLTAVVPAMAADDNYTITIHPGEFTDTKKFDRYQAYQVFTGRLTDDAESGTDASRQIADVTWGCDVNVDDLVDDLVADEKGIFEDAFDGIDAIQNAQKQAQAVADILAENKDDVDFIKEFAKVVAANIKTHDNHPVKSTYTAPDFKITVTEPGYYLIVDAPNGGLAPEDYDVLSEYMLEVLGNQTMSIKADAPTVDKTIPSGQLSYEVNEDVTFRLVGSVAENFQNYDTYLYRFVDNMSKGLDFVDESVVVTIRSTTDNLATVVKTFATTAYDVNTTPGNNGRTVLTISFTDLIAQLKSLNYTFNTQTDRIVVEYKATLTDDAVVAVAETNDVKLEFSNNPQNDGSGDYGTAPGPEVYVYTFGVDIHKANSATYDDDNFDVSGLAGVGFKLYRQVENSEYDEETNNEVDQYLTEYATVTGSNGTYTVDNKNWKNTEAQGTEMTTAQYGQLIIEGLSEGTYYLKETTPKNGFNTMDDIIINVRATYYTDADEALAAGKNVGELKGYKITTDTRDDVILGADGEITTGDYPVVLLNTPATSLPSTGGIGTTVFYIAGGALLAAASLFLVIMVVRKKRKN